MIDVLYFSDKEVKRKLFERVGDSQRLLLVTATRHGRHMRPVKLREPFASLEERLGDRMDQVVVADDGTVEGMWRDPVGDLADALFPNDKRKAYAAASGYVLLEQGRVRSVVKKRGSAQADLHALLRALSELLPGVEAPPEPPRQKASRTAERTQPDDLPFEDEPTPPPQPRPDGTDPFAVLGIPRSATLSEAKKAFHALVAQYHPDKVAHLAPEFRELAETRTRQIVVAWEQVQAQLRRRRS